MLLQLKSKKKKNYKRKLILIWLEKGEWVLIRRWWRFLRKFAFLTTIFSSQNCQFLSRNLCSNTLTSLIFDIMKEVVKEQWVGRGRKKLKLALLSKHFGMSFVFYFFAIILNFLLLESDITLGPKRKVIILNFLVCKIGQRS